jgi:hypothetical protein
MALPTASDNPFPSLLITEGTAPTAPAAGKQRVYIDSTTHKLTVENSGGTSTVIGPGGAAAIATDTIWDAAGDLVQGTGADTAAKLSAGAAGKILTAGGAGVANAWGQGPLTTTGDLMVGATGGTPTRLALGAAGGVVGRVNGAIAWNGGTAFPASKATSDRFWRSDAALGAVWNGTQWVSDHQFVAPLGVVGGTLPISATSNGFMRGPIPYSGLYPFLVEAVITTFYVSGGTALSASHKWVGAISDEAVSSLAYTVNIDSGASDTWRRDSGTGLTTVVTSKFDFEANWTKTGTPGSLYMTVQIIGRIVMT